MTVTEYLIVCEQCRKGATPSDDINPCPGWLRLSYGWRKADKPRNYDFCSTACLLNWLEGWKEKVEKIPLDKPR